VSHAPSPVADAPARGPALELERWLAGREWVVVAALTALAAAVRVVAWEGKAVMFNDGPLFLSLARAMRAGAWSEVLQHPFPPLYPALIAVATPWLGETRAAVAVCVAGGAAAVFALYLLVRSAFGPAEAWVAAALLAVHPVAIDYTADVQSEGLYLALFVGAAAALWPALRDARPGAAALGGALAGAAYWTRPEGIGIALAAGGLLALRVATRGVHRTRGLATLAALVLGAAAVALPYPLLLRAELGHAAFSQKKSLAVLVGLASPPESGPDPELAPDPGAAGPVAPRPRPGPGAGPRGPAESALDVLDAGQHALSWSPLLFLLAGAWAARRRRPGLREAYVFGTLTAYAAVLFALSVSAGYVSGRHALPPLVLAFGHVAWGLLALAALLAPRLGRHARTTPGAVALALLALAAAAGLARALPPSRVQEGSARAAAEWLRHSDRAVRAVAAGKRRTAWYADAVFVGIDPGVDTPASLRRAGASHLVLRDGELPELRARLGDASPIHRAEVDGYGASVFELGNAD
jgi:hypothetical protein